MAASSVSSSRWPDGEALLEVALAPRIFEPGVGGAARVGNGAAGAGLGLALARRLARSVSGDIEADPNARGGRFLVRLPPG